MGNFQGGGSRGGGGFRGGNGGGRPDFKKKSWGGNDRGADRAPVTMHKATCDECGKGCEVPFRPTGEKPIYCSNCFGAKREGGDRGGRRDFDSRGPKREFSNDRPSPRPDFRPQTTQAPVSNDGTAKHLAEISMKLDRLTNAVTRLLDDKIQKEVIKVAPVALKVESKNTSAKTVAKKSAPAKSAKKVVSKKKK
jgi:CxxC-x17-CxxC domain-containing protein